MVVAGLTGGIATGKSTVSAIFKTCGAVIVDADVIAREVVQKGRKAWSEIIDTFGSRILLPDGSINRPALGDIIFHDPVRQQILNHIVHPEVMAETNKRLVEINHDSPDAVVILDVPLLFESGMDKGLSEIIVVYIPEPLQLQRLMHRNALSKDQALARIRSQMPVEEKKHRATRIIDNSGSIDITRKATQTIYHLLIRKN